MRLVTLSVVLVSLLIISLDWAARFWGGHNPSNQVKLISDKTSAITLPSLDAAALQLVQRAFAHFEEDTPTPVLKLPGMPLTEQQQQQGELTEFYAGDNRYRLLAVIFPVGATQSLTKPIALLKATNVKDPKQVTVQKVYQGDTFANGTVSIISTKKILLRQGQRQIELLMYQPRA